MVERYFATSTLGLIYANVVYEKLDTGVLGCYSGYASNVMQLKYFFINNDSEVLITDDETEIDPAMINNDIEKCYSLQGERAKFEDYGDDERQMILSKTKDFDEEIIRKLQGEWSLEFSIE